MYKNLAATRPILPTLNPTPPPPPPPLKIGKVKRKTRAVRCKVHMTNLYVSFNTMSLVFKTKKFNVLVLLFKGRECYSTETT